MADVHRPPTGDALHRRAGLELATLVSMMLADFEEFDIGTEFSPKNLHGLSHREIGDFSEAISLLFESPEPFLDATRGKTSRELLLEGKDEFVVKAGKHGLLFSPMDENGWPIRIRVGRHTSAILQTMESWNENYPDKEIICSNVPRYAELIKNGVGFYLKDPSKAKPDNIIYE